jgi:hypothetical protein
MPITSNLQVLIREFDLKPLIIISEVSQSSGSKKGQKIIIPRYFALPFWAVIIAFKWNGQEDGDENNRRTPLNPNQIRVRLKQIK